MNSFEFPKRLRVKLILAESANMTFESTGTNVLELTDCRASAQIQANARQATTANVKIWGMRLADMDAMTAAWIDPEAVRQNLMTVEADNGDGYRLIYTGQILEAQPDFSSAPEVPFQILSTIRYFQQIDVAEPLSFQGDVTAEFLGNYLAGKLGMDFAAAPGVNATISNPNYGGSYWEQLLGVAMAARVAFYFIGETLVFAPPGQSYLERDAVVLTPTTGLIGYPMYTANGLMMTSIFNPAFATAAAVEVRESLVRGVNGRWNIVSLTHHVESRIPNGKWITTLRCNRKI